MDWNSLKIFLAIADNGSLSSAAKSLKINHSTVFRRLRTFEKEIGGQLFNRINNHYELTTIGQELLSYAHNIADSVNDMERAIVGKDVQPKGIVKITAPNNIAYRYLSRYLSEFHNIYPEIQIELLASNLEFNMNTRQADIAIRATSAPPEYLVGRQVRTIEWSIFASPAYKQHSNYPQSTDELHAHHFIGATGALSHQPGFIWLDKNLPQQIRTRCDDLVAMSYFAEAGHGLAILPNDQQRPELKKLFTFKPAKTSGLWLLTHPDLRNVERIKIVMKYLTTVFTEEKYI